MDNGHEALADRASRLDPQRNGSSYDMRFGDTGCSARVYGRFRSLQIYDTTWMSIRTIICSASVHAACYAVPTFSTHGAMCLYHASQQNGGTSPTHKLRDLSGHLCLKTYDRPIECVPCFWVMLVHGQSAHFWVSGGRSKPTAALCSREIAELIPKHVCPIIQHAISFLKRSEVLLLRCGQANLDLDGTINALAPCLAWEALVVNVVTAKHLVFEILGHAFHRNLKGKLWIFGQLLQSAFAVDRKPDVAVFQGGQQELDDSLAALVRTRRVGLPALVLQMQHVTHEAAALFVKIGHQHGRFVLKFACSCVSAFACGAIAIESHQEALLGADRLQCGACHCPPARTGN